MTVLAVVLVALGISLASLSDALLWRRRATRAERQVRGLTAQLDRARRGEAA